MIVICDYDGVTIWKPTVQLYIDRFAARMASHKLSVAERDEASGGQLENIEALAGLVPDPEEEDVIIEPTKRYKTVDGQKIEIEPQMTAEEQTDVWNKTLSRMVPSVKAGPTLASEWNSYDVTAATVPYPNPPYPLRRAHPAAHTPPPLAQPPRTHLTAQTDHPLHSNTLFVPHMCL